MVAITKGRLDFAPGGQIGSGPGTEVLDQARLELGPTVAIRVATAEGLILLKLLAFRLQDQTDIESLVAANRDAIDVEWTKREWQTIFDLDHPRMLWLLGQISDGPRPADF